ncbi:protoporphyrinogen/coproporphyrinogen oxidase [Tessaracoccus antarcticus]|uniref:FAD-dependent oxidoreductase n=1 Tax=Tessaracoccus antarcticus TaxID=2479848 RepID=A0A3M0G6V2_9ACTN|nr:FAD-dependent oxidoreductase [Tessaracoccus antarcticus]RMB59837.1 FAD-dependent oxidoreductase [Tessaracoccus antarcticus]
MSAVVVGGGLAGLVAARELLQAGESVDLYEADDFLGGLVARQPLGGTLVDGGAEAFAVRTSIVADLCAELGLEVAEPQGQPHIWWPEAPHVWPMANGVLGIPGSLDDPSLLGALTPEERAEAGRDAIMGGDVAADETRLGPLVEARLGRAVVERLVEPVTRGVYGRSPYDMDVDRSAPGLRDAMREHGSLMAAVSAIRQPGKAAVAQPVGGLFRLIDALAADIQRLGGRIHTGLDVRQVQRDGYGWEIRTRSGPLRADRVLLAVGARAAERLLTPLGISFEMPPTHPSFQALLSLRHPGLASGPVGSGVIVGRRDPRLVARALTHYSVKWPWAGHDGRHVVRLAYAASPTLTQALADASLLLGIELAERDVVDFAVLDWEMPTAMPPEDLAVLTEGLAHVDGLAVTGAWVAGNGIAAVVKAAQDVVA